MAPTYDRKHLRRPGVVRREPFRPVRLTFSTHSPEIQNPRAHAAYLSQAILQAGEQAQEVMLSRDPKIAAEHEGVYLSFELADDHIQAVASLESRRREAELAVLLENGPHPVATIYVPEDQLQGYMNDLQRKVAKYAESDGANHKTLVSRLTTAFAGTLKAVFSDDPALFPAQGQTTWWEVWTDDAGIEALEEVARRLDIPLGDERLRFPDRVVVVAQATPERLERLFVNSGAVRELRLANDTPESFLEMDNVEQAEWTHDLQGRVTYQPAEPEVAALILDGGTTQSHVLIAPFLHVNDWQVYDRRWSPGEDSFVPNVRGHGTAMAGLALYGDLTPALWGSYPVTVNHRLETVKVLPPHGYHKPPLLGAVTREAIEGMEVTNPFRKRVIGMALTSSYQTRFGRPSSWSAAIDQLTFGEDDEDYRRLIVLAAGNIRTDIDPALYADHTELNREVTSEIESPGQAWNALTVGAYTAKCTVPPHLRGYRAYAPEGDLSPRSRTSYPWDKQWPVKPDIVVEGGNLLSDGTFTYREPSVGLLTAHHDPTTAHFAPFTDTSAATAVAVQMAAQLCADDPARWPETVRGLMVHSAEWTPAMQARLGRTKDELVDVLRQYGYGVPRVNRARGSALNDVTFIAQERLKPFELVNGNMQFREMHFHPLPWPRINLADLENTMLEMRITLSYFVEPNPSERGQGMRFRYASHGLRFDLKGRYEDERTFRQRMNALARAEGHYETGAPRGAANWVIGPQTRRMAGSLYSDWWRGPAIELAECDSIAVYPTGGWWKARPRPPFSERQARYSLIVTLRTTDPEATIDLYTPIATLIQAETEIEI